MAIITPDEVTELARGLADAQVRYLVVGGLAVIANGHVRFTQDIDLVVDFDGANEQRCAGALEALGFRPRAPVPLRAWTDPALRHQWRDQKDMIAFSVWRESRGMQQEIDLFLHHPFDFAAAYAGALWKRPAPDAAPIPFVNRAVLIAMKRAAGRPQDLVDALALEHLA